MSGKVKAIVGGMAVLVFLLMGACSMTVVDTGHRGVKVRFGEVIGAGLPEGLYFINPFTTHLVEMDTRVLKWEGETQAYTKDVQQAAVHFTLNYRLDPTKAHVVLQAVGVDWVSRLVGQIVHEDIKSEFGQHEAVNIIAVRAKAADKIRSDLTTHLAEKDVVVTGFQLTNIDYTKEFEDSVEAKVIAQQKAIEEQNRTVQRQEQANQAVIAAKGEAESTLIKAKAEAESIRIRGDALNQNARLVEYQAILEWDGKLPVYMLGSATPFIQIPSK